MIRIAIADDHSLFAEGLKNALQTQPDFVVTAVTDNGADLRQVATSQPVDVALVDFEMPGGGTGLVSDLDGTCRVIVVTMYPDGASSQLAGTDTVILNKSTPLLTLSAWIRATNAGFRPGPDTDPAEILERFGKPVLDPGAESLTDREIEVLQMLARGVSSTEDLADALYISQKTVKNHLASIFAKLAVSDRTQAALEAIRLGIASPRGDH